MIHTRRFFFKKFEFVIAPKVGAAEYVKSIYKNYLKQNKIERESQLFYQVQNNE